MVGISRDVECKHALKFASAKLCRPARNIFPQIKWDSLKFQNYFSNKSRFWIAHEHTQLLKYGEDSILESDCVATSYVT